MSGESSNTKVLLSGANVPGLSFPVDILVEGGLASTWQKSKSETGSSVFDDHQIDKENVVDLRGQLLLPALVENHAHLDKALTADVIINESGDLMGAIDAWVRAEEAGVLGLEEMHMRAERALEQLVLSGVTSVRTHVNVGGSDPGLRNLRAVDVARKSFAGLIDVDLVALMHSPMTGSDGRGNRTALERAIEYGIDFIGGCPHLEPDSAGMIGHVLEAARVAQLPLDLHVDETLDPGMLSIELLARAILDQGFDLGVTASHCVSLGMQPLEDQHRLARLLSDARVRVVALPQTNLFLQGWDHPCATPRGITPLRLLKEHGVEIAAGGDNIQDPFNPMGRSDPLETASLFVTAGHLDPLDAFDAVSTMPIAHKALLEQAIGRPADFVAIEADGLRGAIATASASRSTIRRGRIVARTTVQRRITGTDLHRAPVVHSKESRRSSS